MGQQQLAAAGSSKHVMSGLQAGVQMSCHGCCAGRRLQAWASQRTAHLQLQHAVPQSLHLLQVTKSTLTARWLLSTLHK